jgi:hypothetical protein
MTIKRQDPVLPALPDSVEEWLSQIRAEAIETTSRNRDPKEGLREDVEDGKRQDLLFQRKMAKLAELDAKIDTLDEARFRGDPELHAAFLEYKEAVAESTKLPPLFETHRFRGKTGKTKLGRPSLWRGYTGAYFVLAVNLARRGRSCSIKGAIRYAVDHAPGLEALRDTSIAALQVRYTEASKSCALFLDHPKFLAVVSEYYANVRRRMAASKRVVSALSRTSGPGDFS